MRIPATAANEFARLLRIPATAGRSQQVIVAARVVVTSSTAVVGVIMLPTTAVRSLALIKLSGL